MKKALMCLIIVLFAGAIANAQPPDPSVANPGQNKLLDIVRNTSGNIEFSTQREFSPADLPDLVQESDLIAHVLVIEARSRLSADEHRIETDYIVEILDAYFRAITGQSDRRIVVSRPGGTLTVDGRAISSYEPDFPNFQVGEEFVLFLRFDSQRDAYIVPHGAQGAFLQSGGYADQVSRFDGKFKAERGKVPSAIFAQEIRELASKR